MVAGAGSRGWLGTPTVFGRLGFVGVAAGPAACRPADSSANSRSPSAAAMSAPSALATNGRQHLSAAQGKRANSLSNSKDAWPVLLRYADVPRRPRRAAGRPKCNQHREAVHLVTPTGVPLCAPPHGELLQTLRFGLGALLIQANEVLVRERRDLRDGRRIFAFPGLYRPAGNGPVFGGGSLGAGCVRR
jgi:hypothetical protein